MSETSVLLNLFLASEEYGPVKQYDIVVVSKELANTMKPDDIKQEDVGLFIIIIVLLIFVQNSNELYVCAIFTADLNKCVCVAVEFIADW